MPKPKKLSSGPGGRILETWPPLAREPHYREDAVEEWLVPRRNSRRPMTVAVPLLAVVCALHARGHYLPVRRRLAATLGTTPDAIDSAINCALAEGEITEEYRTEKGANEKRDSII
jgi:hypothetical protein